MTHKFNPDYHSSMVANLRALWASNLPDCPLKLSDKGIYDAYMETYFCDESEFTEFPNLSRRDAAALVGLQEANENA